MICINEQLHSSFSLRVCWPTSFSSMVLWVWDLLSSWSLNKLDKPLKRAVISHLLNLLPELPCTPHLATISLCLPSLFFGRNNLCSPQDQPSFILCTTGDRAVAFTAIDYSFSHQLSLFLASGTLHVTGSPLICLTVPLPCQDRLQYCFLSLYLSISAPYSYSRDLIPASILRSWLCVLSIAIIVLQNKLP